MQIFRYSNIILLSISSSKWWEHFHYQWNTSNLVSFCFSSFTVAPTRSSLLPLIYISHILTPTPAASTVRNGLLTILSRQSNRYIQIFLRLYTTYLVVPAVVLSAPVPPGLVAGVLITLARNSGGAEAWSGYMQYAS